MKPIFAVLVSVSVLTTAAFAQNAPTQPGPGGPPGAGAPPSAGPDAPGPGGSAQPKGKEVREQCKADAVSQGLRGPQRKAFIQDCVAKVRPDLAAAQQCRQQGKAQGMADADLKAFVRNCKKGGAAPH